MIWPFCFVLFACFSSQNDNGSMIGRGYPHFGMATGPEKWCIVSRIARMKSYMWAKVQHCGVIKYRVTLRLISEDVVFPVSKVPHPMSFCHAMCHRIWSEFRRGYLANYQDGHSPQASFNTLRPKQNGCQLPDDIFKCIFLNENI